MATTPLPAQLMVARAQADVACIQGTMARRQAEMARLQAERIRVRVMERGLRKFVASPREDVLVADDWY